MIIIDAHNDTFDRRLGRAETFDLTVDMPHLDTDLARLKAGGVTAQFHQVGMHTLVYALKLLDAARRMCTDYPQHFRWVSTAADIEQAQAEGQVGIVGQLESCTCLEGELSTLRMFRRLGVIVAGVTHGEAPDHGLQADKSPWGSCTLADREAARRIFQGLTPFGREAIPEINRLRMIVDLAHANDAAFWQVLEFSETPPIFSHGNAFAQCPNWRNLTDEQITALAEKGGVMGVAFYRRFIDPDEATVERLVDHVEHIVNLVGIEHVGIGADWDGLGDDEVAIPKDPAHLHELPEAMERRGFNRAEIAAFMGLNWLRMIREVVG